MYETSRGPMKTLYFTCEQASGFKNQYGNRNVDFAITEDRLQKLLNYKCAGQIILGNYYDLVYRDYQDNKELRIGTIYPYRDPSVANPIEVPQFNKEGDSGEADLPF